MAKQAGPDNQSAAYKRMAPRWAMIDTLLGGTEAMRAAARDYLPQHMAEEDVRYGERLRTNVLLNMTELTLDSLTGKPFKEPVKPKDVPAQLEPLLDDMDLQGNGVDVFGRRWFREGVAKAHSHVLVDFPRTRRDDGQPRTLADDRAEGVRPYCVHVPPENVIFAHSEIVHGQERLTHVRIWEESVEVVGWEEQRVERIRVLTPGFVEVYRKGRGPNGGWEKEDEYPTDLDYVPMVTFYTDRTGPFEGKPPLLDLAYLNVAHWQSSSDQRAILTVGRFPILAVSGVEGEEMPEIKLGPYTVLSTPDPSGRYYYVEHGGAAIEAGRQDLEGLEAQMASYGAEFLKRKPGNATATARALDSAEAISPLQAMALEFEDAMRQVLGMMADWLGLGMDGGSVEVCKGFELDAEGEQDVTHLIAARKNRDISREAFLHELMRRGILDEEYDAEADEERLTAEAETSMALFAGTDLDPGAAPDNDDDDPPPGE